MGLGYLVPFPDGFVIKPGLPAHWVPAYAGTTEEGAGKTDVGAGTTEERAGKTEVGAGTTDVGAGTTEEVDVTPQN